MELSLWHNNAYRNNGI